MNVDNPTRILWVNPLGNDEHDRPMADYMATIKSAETRVDTMSFRMTASPNHLEYRTYEALIIGDTVRAARHAAQSNYDAMVIGCFYDPGLEDAREISGDTVVVAPCQASVQIAANLCNRFSVIVGRDKWVEQMTERVNTYGYGSRLASMRSIEIAAYHLQDDCALTVSRILDAGRKAIEEDKAEALILGCTCTFGLFEAVQKELGVPVIDPICAALKTAEHLADLRKRFDWTPSRVGSCEPPPEEELASFGLFNDESFISEKVSV